jgi:hypothetical protein
MDEISQMLFQMARLFFQSQVIKVQSMQCCTATKKELIMSPIDIAAIERRARQLRAEEIRRVEGLFAERMVLLGRLLAATVFSAALSVAQMLRPMFSWNPQAAPAPAEPAVAKPHVAMRTRLNRAARRLFAWNPEVHHHV